MIEMFLPYVPKEAPDEVSDTLSTRWIGQGPKVELFEQKFMDLFGVKYSASLNSGTAALETAYDLIGIEQDDEVITTPLTCTATNLPLLQRKAKIIWADVLPDTLCIDPDDVARKITPQTKAVVQVHLGGIKAEVRDLDIPIVSDAAQALGLFVGDYTCNSFQAIKHITTGDGGMLTCPDELTYKRAKLLRWFGIDREKKIAAGWQAYKERKMTFDIVELGYKRQMNDIAARMGIVGLDHYFEVMMHREKIFNIYRERLSNISGMELVDSAFNYYWLCTLLVENRDGFASMLYEQGVDTNIVQVRNDVYKVFGGQRADLPVLNEIEEKYISIPFGTHISEEEAHYICDAIEGGW